MAAKKKKAKSAKDAAPKKVSAFPTLSLILLWMVIGMLVVLGARAGEGQTITAGDLIPYALWGLSAILWWTCLRLFRYRGPPALPGWILILIGLGVLIRSRMGGSVESWQGVQQLILPGGFLLLLVGWVLARRKRAAPLCNLWPLFYLLSLAVVGAIIVMGSAFRGMVYGPGGMTPTEVLKVTLPLALAGFFGNHMQRWENRRFWRSPPDQLFLLVVGWVVLSAAILWQRDLGLLVLITPMLCVVLISVSGSLSWLWAGAVGTAASCWAILRYLPHGARRIETWLNPFDDPTGAGWQVLQGLTGLYAGGLAGTGLGAGRPDRLPIASSDFVYAVVGEELGFIGCMLLLIVYWRILRAAADGANQQSDPRCAVLATALLSVLGVQVLVNIGGVVGLLPITGINLPAISTGGSSFWVTCLQLGLLLGLCDPPPPKTKKKWHHTNRSGPPE